MLPATTLGDGISRQDLVRSPHVWVALCGTFALFAVAIAGLAALGWPHEASRARLAGFAALLAAVTIVLVRSRAPEPDTPQAHALLAAVYVGPALALWAFQPVGSAAIASAMFVGPLVAMWTTSLRDAIAHLSAASVVLTLPCVLGIANDETITAVIALVPATWVLAGCIWVVFSSCEIQGEQLAHMMRRDPLTGAGNRRLLEERLAIELQIHAARHQQLSLLALDLNGFKAINDTYGHAAGDELLVAVADALRGATGSRDIVVRQGGDEFCVLLPGCDRARAQQAAERIARALQQIERTVGRGAVSSGIGIAVFPDDGDAAAAVLSAADAALRTSKLRTVAAAAAPAPIAAGASANTPAPQDASPSPPRRRQAILADGVGRRELEHHPAIWGANAGMYLLYGVLGVVAMILFPSVAGPWLPPVVALGALIGAVYLILGPPTIGTAYNHVGIATTYLVPWLILITCAPGGTMAIGCMVFTGPLAATRLLDRRQIAGHYAAATVLIGGLVPLGLTNLPTTLAILILIGTMWVLGVCCVIVLEGAEAQTEQLRIAVRQDPLTGIGNRRALDEFLAQALEARPLERELSVIALDLNCFKALNDTLGHGAGDELLVEVATALATLAGPDDLVIRQGGDEFCVVLGGVGQLAVGARIETVRAALAGIDCGGSPLSTGAGWATFPGDGTAAQQLLDAADHRLLADKAARAADQRRPAPLRKLA